MKKKIALLLAVGLLLGMVTPVMAEGEITTYKGEQEIVLTEAGDADLTFEELVQKSRDAMKDTEDLSLHMAMDVDANVSADVSGQSMSMDMIMKMEMSQMKNNGTEYSAEKNDDVHDGHEYGPGLGRVYLHQRRRRKGFR